MRRYTFVYGNKTCQKGVRTISARDTRAVHEYAKRELEAEVHSIFEGDQVGDQFLCQEFGVSQIYCRHCVGDAA